MRVPAKEARYQNVRYLVLDELTPFTIIYTPLPRRVEPLQEQYFHRMDCGQQSINSSSLISYLAASTTLSRTRTKLVERVSRRFPRFETKRFTNIKAWWTCFLVRTKVLRLCTLYHAPRVKMCDEFGLPRVQTKLP